MLKEDIDLINQYSKYPLKEEDIYVFTIDLCNNMIDKDFEQISNDSLEKLSKMFVNKTGLIDDNTPAKIFKTHIHKNGNFHYLKASAYIIKNKDNEEIIEEIQGKLSKKEISIGCSFEKITCFICGESNCNKHKKEGVYEGKMCYHILENPKEVFEWSMVASPTKIKRSKNMKIYNQKEILAEGYDIENNVIESFDIEIIAHYGNCVCLQAWCKNLPMFSIYNNTKSIGHLIKFLVEFFNQERKDGIMLSEIKNIPCRLVFESNDVCVGFGHFMKDKFVLTKEFMNMENVVMVDKISYMFK